MAQGAMSLKGLRAQIAAAAQAQAEERRSLTGNSPGPTTNTAAKPQGPRPVIDGASLRIDDRLRVARERREEAEKHQALRESQILERDRKAKLQVERQMEERQKKVEEQRRKEEQRRSAVEEKRKQKQEEEKEHYEAVMRRTLERSQKVEQRQKRWSWGGLSTDSDGRTGDSDTSASSPVAIVISPASPEKPPRKQQVDKRSTSTTNLKQPSEASINKRLSSSSATLIKSPDKSVKRRSSSCNRLPSNNNQATKEDSKKLQVEQTGPTQKKRSSSLTRVGGRAQSPAKPDKGTTDDQARRPLASAMDGGVLSRLLTPTQASLARSKSATILSADGSDTPASASPLHPPRGPLRSRSIDRQKSDMANSVSAEGPSDASLKEKRLSSPGVQRLPASSNVTGRHRSPSPAPNPAPKRTPSPAAPKQSPRTRPPSPGTMKQRPPSPQPTTAKQPPSQKPALTPTGPPTLRKRDSKTKELLGVQALLLQSPDTNQTATTPSPTPATSTASSKTKEKDDPKAAVGTSSAAEASKIMAENRRLAREQKEKEEQLRLQKENEEKLKKEEEMRLAEEARLKQVEEEKKLAEERKKKEEEDALREAEEKEKLAAEEAEKQAELQREREEAEAKALEEAEKVRQERDRIMQQNAKERMERKKRIMEIMKRTRKVCQILKRDAAKAMQGDQEDDGEDDANGDASLTGDEDAMEMDTTNKDECDLSNDEPMGEREEPGDQNDLKRDDDKDRQDDHENEGEDKVNVGETALTGDNDAMEMETTNKDDEPMGKREEPLGSVNGKPETDDKENNYGVSTDETQAVSPGPKGRLVEGSEFVNEVDSTKVASVPGLNGRSGPWSFEELIDLNVHSKSHPLIDTEECNQGLIDCDGDPDGPMVAFEDKGNPVSVLHSSSQPIEALSEM